MSNADRILNFGIVPVLMNGANRIGLVRMRGVGTTSSVIIIRRNLGGHSWRNETMIFDSGGH